MDETPIETEMEKFHTSPWTNHPFVSVWTVGNNVFTKKTRCSIVWIQCINWCLFAAVFYASVWTNGSMGDLFLFGLYANLISGGIAFFHGILLRLYYINKKIFTETNKEEDD